MLTHEAIEALLDAGRRDAKPATLHQTNARGVVVLATKDQRIETFSVERGADRPLRKRGAITVFDVCSFNRALAQHDDGIILIYVDRDPAAPKITAVLNGHTGNGPGWGDHRAHLELRTTPQWKKWTGLDGRMIDQLAFAEHIEDNLADIVDPPGATMLEIAQHLEATRTAAYKSGIRLASGAVQFQNLENVEAKVGPRRLEIPEAFTLGLAPLRGLPPYRVPARFRWRIAEGGALKLGVRLQRIEDLMQTVLTDVVAQIDLSSGKRVLLDGIAPAAIAPE